MNRRRLTLAVCIGLAAAPVFAEEAMTLHPQVERLSFRAPGRVLPLRDGRLACSSKGSFLVSDDDGANWRPVGKVEPGSGPKVDGGMLVEDLRGNLVLIHRDEASLQLERTPDNRPLPGAQLHVWAVRSSDGGRTWRDPAQLIHGFCGAMIDAIGTRDGRVVVPLQELRYDPPRHVTVVFSSADGGATWHRSDDLDIGGNGVEDGGFESTVAERPDGSLLMILRTPRDRLWKSESRDGGRTWTLATPTDVRASNSPAFVRTLADGRLAMIYNPLHPAGRPDWPRREKPRYAERPDSVYREELCLAFSGNGGETWTPPTTIARQPGGKLRYGYFFEHRPGELRLALKGEWLRIRTGDFLTTQ